MLRKARVILAFLAAAVILSACGSLTMGHLRQEHEGRIVFTVPENYRTVYEHAVEQAEVCLDTRYKARLYTKDKTAHVSHYHEKSTLTYYGADIRYLEEYLTEVTVYYRDDFWKEDAQVMARWLKHGNLGCVHHKKE